MFKRYRVLIWDDEKVLDMDGGDACASGSTKCRRALKKDENDKFHVTFFFYNLKKNNKRERKTKH